MLHGTSSVLTKAPLRLKVKLVYSFEVVKEGIFIYIEVNFRL